MTRDITVPQFGHFQVTGLNYLIWRFHRGIDISSSAQHEYTEISRPSEEILLPPFSVTRNIDKKYSAVCVGLSVDKEILSISAHLEVASLDTFYIYYFLLNSYIYLSRKKQ